jgi:hypothetical protein
MRSVLRFMTHAPPRSVDRSGRPREIDPPFGRHGVLNESLIHPLTITLPSAGIGAPLLMMAVHLD